MVLELPALRVKLSDSGIRLVGEEGAGEKTVEGLRALLLREELASAEDGGNGGRLVHDGRSVRVVSRRGGQQEVSRKRI